MRKIIALLLTLVTLLGVTGLTACKEETVATKSSIVLDGFEEFEKDFLTLRSIHHFGKINMNTDKEFVKFGNGSAKIEPYGPTDTTAKPILVVQNSSERYEYDYSDYTKVNKISAWFYNAEERDLTVGVGLAFSNVYSYNNRRDALDRTSAITYVLTPGWNYVEYKIEPTYLSLYERFNVENVCAIYFEFEHTNELEAVAPVIYMDDVRLHYLEDAVTGEEITLNSDSEKGVWELADFEDVRQNFFWYSRHDSVRTDARLETNVISPTKYNVIAPSGNNVLEVVRRSGQIGTSTYPRLWFSSDIFNRVVAEIGEDFKNNPQNYNLVFDYYNASPLDDNLLTVRCGAAGIEGSVQLDVSVNCPAYTWATYSMNISKINDKFVQDFNKGDKKSILVTGNQPAVFSNAPGEIVIASATYSGEEDLRDRVFLIDNIRIERVAVA